LLAVAVYGPARNIPGCGASLRLRRRRQLVSRLVDRGRAQQSAWLADLEVVEYSSERAGLRQGIWLLDVSPLFRRVA